MKQYLIRLMSWIAFGVPAMGINYIFFKIGLYFTGNPDLSYFLWIPASVLTLPIWDSIEHLRIKWSWAVSS